MNERRQDFELLQRFARHGEQAAFADVVRRYLDLVYGTAMRKVEDPGAGQEVAHPPAVTGGQFTVTNPVSGPAQFFRLRKP